MSVAVIFPLVAPAYVGKGATRFFSKIEGREVFLRCVEMYTPREQVIQRIVVATPDDMEEMRDRYSAHLGFQGVTVAGGGSDWFGCVTRGLEKLKEEVQAVFVHDPCCPAVPFTLLDAMEEGLSRNKNAGGVVAVLPARSAFCDLEGEGAGRSLKEYVDMAAVSEVQSPQLFRKAALVEAYAKRGDGSFVDDAELVMNAGFRVVTVGGSRLNMRIDSEEMARLGKDLIEHLPRPKSRTPLTPFGEAEW
jgi:2-C-methyl-D-erythritol 4-phosphate cytidylyltransferase